MENQNDNSGTDKKTFLNRISQIMGITKVPIMARIGFTLLLPVLGLVGASGYVATSNYNVASELSDVVGLAEVSPQISALVHEMQKERGLSAGYIGSKGAITTH